MDSNDRIMKGFMRECAQRPEFQAVVSDHTVATLEQRVYMQALSDAELMLARVLWPSLDSMAVAARVGALGQQLLVERSGIVRHA